jgi:biotin carboxylase
LKRVSLGQSSNAGSGDSDSTGGCVYRGDSGFILCEGTGAPIVVKADGLAAGKGVTVATSVEQALGAIEAIFKGQFGRAGKFVVKNA